MPVHRPTLPLAEVTIKNVLDMLHNEVYSNCRKKGKR